MLFLGVWECIAGRICVYIATISRDMGWRTSSIPIRSEKEERERWFSLSLSLSEITGFLCPQDAGGVRVRGKGLDTPMDL